MTQVSGPLVCTCFPFYWSCIPWHVMLDLFRAIFFTAMVKYFYLFDMECVIGKGSFGHILSKFSFSPILKLQTFQDQMVSILYLNLYYFMSYDHFLWHHHFRSLRKTATSNWRYWNDVLFSNVAALSPYTLQNLVEQKSALPLLPKYMYILLREFFRSDILMPFNTSQNNTRNTEI